MPDAIITSTESTFGTISGTFAADQSTVTGTVTGIVAGTLSGSVGVPGPAGVGLPAGGTEGQIIIKASATDYDTVWADNSAETLTATVRNETGATLSKGTVVYINGAAGNKATVTKASAASESSSSKTFAILAQDIPNNQNGTAVTVGLLKNVDTSAFSPGANLWLSTTAGQITQTMPVSPNHAVFLGNAVRIHANQGEIEVRIQNGLELGELHDVLLTSPTNGQVLKYNSSTGLWVNGTDVGVPAGGTAGQFLQKIDSTDYNTDWVTVNLGNYLVKSNNLSDVTDAALARTNLGLGTMATATAADYSTTAVANGLYYPLSSNPAGYITSAALSPYLLSSTAASTYQTIAGMSSYLTTASAASTYYPLTNPSGYITTSALTGYATESWVTSQGYLTDAPSDGSQYLRQNGAWTTVSVPPDFITSVSSPLSVTSGDLSIDLSAYETVSSAAATYQTISGMSSYLTTSAASATYQTISGMNAYLTTSAAASTYFTIANAANKADLASPAFTGNPTAPTATAGTNTTQIATTAFVQTSNPDASTTTKGHVELATNAEVITGTSSSLATVPASLPFSLTDPRLRSMAHISFTRVSGSGAVTAGSVGFGVREMYLASLAAGRAGFSYGWTGLAATNMSSADWAKIDFSKKIWISGAAMCGATVGGTSYIGDANTMNRVTLGGYTSDSVSGDMTVKGIGWKKVGGTSPFFTLTVHNGTTLTDVATTISQSAGKVISWMIYSDGTGNVTLYIDGAQAATTSAGPTGTTNANQATYREQVEAVSTPGVRGIMECSGGMLYIEA